LEEAEKFEREARAGWEDGTRFDFVIFDRDSDAYAGGVGINFINQVHGFANLGYWVSPAWEGRGVATTAARLAARFALDEVGLQRVEIVVAPDNVASQRVAEKSGAVREGLLRRRLRIHGAALDAVMYSIVE
jgi:RimJ/RimL family protein N-acetyltransferase